MLFIVNIYVCMYKIYNALQFAKYILLDFEQIQIHSFEQTWAIKTKKRKLCTWNLSF